MKPMLLTDVGTDITPYLSDDWMLQQKHDGARVIFTAHRVPGMGWDAAFLNRQGKPMTFAAAALKFAELSAHLLRDLESLGVDSVTLDGELIVEDGVYHVFDVLHLIVADNILVDGRERLSERDTVMRARLSALEGSQVRFAVTAGTPDQKSQMWHLLQEAGVEGAVSKRWDSYYVPGARSKDWVKHKLVKTADVVVLAAERKFKASNGIVEFGSAELSVPISPEQDPKPWVNLKGKRFTADEAGARPFKDFGGDTGPLDPAYHQAYQPRTMLPVGNASLIGKELTIGVGSVVEVNYLMWTGDAMIQPRIVCERFDKAAADCDLAQFPAYTREAVQLPAEAL